MDSSNEKWTVIIKSKSPWLEMNLGQIWAYRDLIALFIKRDFTTIYKQTILGPFWHLIQPLLSSFAFAFAFSYIGRISTAGVPPVLYYMSGMIPWSYFSDCALRSSNILRGNAGLYGKIYFPRMVTPIYLAISNLIRFAIQLLMLVFLTLFLTYKGDFTPQLNSGLLWMPVLIIQMAFLGTGIGLFISSFTVRYRDLSNIIGFALQVLMYLSPVVFPVELWPEHLKWIVHSNPMTPVIQTFRSSFQGGDSIEAIRIIYSLGVSLVVLLAGVLVFNRMEKNFIDIV